ncbi:Epimerase family protein [Gemmata obscuriglobus]|uniref:TIGR01777 family protein n=1 Tax=Gemmata obscuriglobus TaxID=114 RepID=A0A2Z3HH13_9BACT|nr:TIGR01777 family oxidoreductase [Gemmata obscuriglobus]AWM40680.1 TIGR01777 family protein [Gemmata obscuriglobus]QEG26053.1 Epimerase family protein [Gemmata obscuriglobus]VTS00442.1 nucleoside-diphosphate sugar epimerase : Hypothetical 317 kDa protein-putative nucleoside-diphosphate sugar epimerase OS=Blastopirellula marina DSM 3645 GN=DSM3645_25522 PE=4 SV=1: Polyketide_cyc: Epimerase: DUF1731 [Gemmata obscuriglobus UQM 2246]
MPDDVFTLRSPMPVSADELYAWHARPLAFRRLAPPWEDTQVVKQEGAFGTEGFRVTLRTNVVGPVSGTWLAESYNFRPGLGFRDRQLEGPFAAFNHNHEFIPNGPDHSFLEDRIEYRVPLGWPGRVLGSGIVKRRLAQVFAYRHFITASDLARHAKFADRPRLTVAVTGSRGLVGSELVPLLTTGGHRVVRLLTGDARPPYDDGTTWTSWKPDAPLASSALEGVDALVHLAGDNVAEGRWTAAKKQKIVDSRDGPTRALVQSLVALPAERRPKVFVCASAVGFYGDRGEEELTEESAAGTGFFPEVTKKWEEACAPARDAGIRVVNLRIGVVLSPKGGALGKQLLAFKAGGGAVLGSGRQFVPWITVNDTAGAIYHTLMNESVSGPVNIVGPNPVTNREFTKALGRVLNRPAFLWLPRFALRALFGEIADEALLASMKARPAKLAMTGFTFSHTELEPALRFLLGR